MPDIQFTYDNTCPWCGEILTDLWDHDWTGKDTIEIDCIYCGRPISVLAEVSYVVGKSVSKGERFEVDECVQIWDHQSTLHGHTGTIVAVQSDDQHYQHAMILVGGAVLPQWWPCAKLRRVDERST